MNRLAFFVFLAALVLCGLTGFGTSMTFLWPAYLAVGLAAALGGVLVFFKREKIRSRPSRLCIAAGVVLTAYLLFRGFSSPVTYLAREDIALATVWFAVWILAALVFSRSHHRIGLARVLVVLSIANLGFAAWQFAVDPGFWIAPGYTRSYLDRVGGVFNNPNHFAGFLAATAPFFLAIAIWGRIGPHRRLLLVFLAALSLLALALTKSRGGMLAAAAGLLVLAGIAVWLHRAVWRQRAGLAFTVFGAAAVGVIGLAAVNFQVLEERFSRDAFSQAMEANRPLLWKAALEQNAESPLVGTGSRTYFYYSRKFRSPEMHVSVEEADFAHNDYVQMIADYGWIGFAFLGVFVFAHGRSGIQLLRRHSREHRDGIRLSLQSRHLALTIGALAGLAALGIHASVDFLLHVPSVAIVAALFLGFLANPGHLVHRTRSEAPSPFSPSRFPAVAARAALPLAGAALLIFGATFVRSEWHFERARKLFANEAADLGIFGHLYRTRELDPANPFAHSLSGHAHLYAIDQSMPEPIRIAYLEKARRHFENGLARFPQDIYGMLGLASCLDSLERHEEAGQVLAAARSWAPLYGNIMHAQGNHHLRLAHLDEAERFFTEARDAGAFRDWRAANRALEQVASARQKAAPASSGAVAER